jgi:hypothetical protein
LLSPRSSATEAAARGARPAASLPENYSPPPPAAAVAAAENHWSDD